MVGSNPGMDCQRVPMVFDFNAETAGDSQGIVANLRTMWCSFRGSASQHPEKFRVGAGAESLLV
ncbi:hypothetical protein HMPREF1484_01940 [Dermabacter sp. HFH0086]|nr:hypothetical protein HMPREF1484_01940 [Dermabacter sp. HFH0086]